MYRVFTRTWWKRNPNWPGGREPGTGRKYSIARFVETEEQARAIARRYNDSHDPGFLSRKAEYERES